MSIEEKQNFLTYRDSDSIYPETEKEVSHFIKKFYKSNVPVELIGSGSKRKIGKSLQCEKNLYLSKLSGIIEYLPQELYIKVKACTPIELIEGELKKKNQQLAFEPINLGYLLNGKSDFGTAAGQVSCNISGPRRFKAGSIRDHVLGFRGVNGRGEIIKSGGTVVKNVTGYDLSKLICGSYGTLVALTEITFKVLPAPAQSKTLIIHNQNIASAADFLDKAISSSNDVSGATFLPEQPEDNGCVMDIEKTFKLNDLKHKGSLTGIRIEGSKISIEQRAKNLINDLKINNLSISTLETYQSEIFWNKVKNLEFFCSSKNNILRIVIPPSECIKLIYQLSNNFKYYLDWGGALIWMEVYELTEEMFESIRKKVVKIGGYITMIKNSDYLPYVEDVFTINNVRFNISQNIKKSFDPKRILNPGKMYTGI
ncbi:MAG: glycolate oxidase FAD binding subunit [Pelagibacterales bacterium]|nr:glycolate oxidase FAD binding subunit [Pelagibacterales bacterium]